MAKRIKLQAWAAEQFDPPPCAETRRRWVRRCRIYPPPVLIGRTYYVESNARYVDPSDTNTLMERIRDA